MAENTEPQTRLISVADNRFTTMIPHAKVLVEQMIENVEEELKQFKKGEE